MIRKLSLFIFGGSYLKTVRDGYYIEYDMMGIIGRLRNGLRKLIQRFKEGIFNVFPKIHWSQDGTDLFLKYYFRGVRGHYVDIGAYHPFRFSNTAMLYYSGWSGLNIDPSEKTKRLFDFWRKRDTNIRCMAGNGEDVIYEKRKDGACNGAGENGETFKTVGLYAILGTAYKLYGNIDLLTIDAEGMDLEILRSHDWNSHRPKIVIVEVNHGGDFDGFMQEIGYRLIGKTILNNIYERT